MSNPFQRSTWAQLLWLHCPSTWWLLIRNFLVALPVFKERVALEETRFYFLGRTILSATPTDEGLELDLYIVEQQAQQCSLSVMKADAG